MLNELLVIAATALVALAVARPLLVRRPPVVAFMDEREERLTRRLAHATHCSVEEALPAVRQEDRDRAHDVDVVDRVAEADPLPAEVRGHQAEEAAGRDDRLTPGAAHVAQRLEREEEPHQHRPLLGGVAEEEEPRRTGRPTPRPGRAAGEDAIFVTALGRSAPREERVLLSTPKPAPPRRS